MMLKVLTHSITLLCLIAATNAARILGIFPIPAKSHFSCNHAILKSLHAAGHQVTMITPFPSEKKLENFTYIAPPEAKFSFVGTQASADEWTDMPLAYLMEWAGGLAMEYCEHVVALPEIQNVMRSSEKLYDVVFAEFLLDFLCYLPIAEKLGVPMIATVTLHSLRWADNEIGLPNNLAVIPADLDSSSVEMDFIERLNNVWQYFKIEYHFSALRKKIEKLNRKLFPEDLLDKTKVSLVFYNTHASMLPRPSVPNAIDVGGIHMTPAQPLPKDIQKFIDEASHGVILFTFGSVVRGSSMPKAQKEAFLTAFASIPQRVIWKFEEPIENLPKNIMISSWLPQRDILEHKNVIAFMSHCGQSGVYEAVVSGTPVVTIPIFGDQRPNAAVLQYRGVGVDLNFRTATKETVLAALNTIVNDTRYYQRMQELSRVFKDRPMTPQESVVYWTEYVIRHNGASQLRALGADMPLYKHLMLDLIALGLAFMSLAAALIYIVIRKIYILVTKKPNHKVCPKKNE